jgi:ornithine decarboxylase
VPGRMGLIVRLALPKGRAKLDLSGKFGASAGDAAALLRAARSCATTLGASFHVGSQCLDPLAWRDALRLSGEVIRAAGVSVDVIDIGGGFPVAYPDQEPPPLGAFFAEIEAGFERLGLLRTRLWAEPGRALVAGGTSVVLQVQARRGGALYVNDGVYGSLADAGALGFRYPVRLIRPGGGAAAETVDFSLFGPTCDSADVMCGPFHSPAGAREGDWIGQLVLMAPACAPLSAALTALVSSRLTTGCQAIGRSASLPDFLRMSVSLTVAAGGFPEASELACGAPSRISRTAVRATVR